MDKNLICFTKQKILIGFIFITSFLHGQQSNNVKDVVGCLSAYSFAGHCLMKNERNTIDYGINGIPKFELLLTSSKEEIILEINKFPVIIPTQIGVQQICLKEVKSGDTLFVQQFFVVNTLDECKSKMDSTIILKSCSNIKNNNLRDKLIYGEPNKIILNVDSLDTDKIKIRFTNGEIIQIGEGFITVYPGLEKISELTFEYDGSIIAKSMFIIVKKNAMNNSNKK